MSKLLLVNGLGSSVSIVNELLSGADTDMNIYLSYPLGVLALAGWVRQELPDMDIQILDIHMDFHKAISRPDREAKDIDEFIGKELDRVNFVPDYIGFSMSISNGHLACLKAINECKKKWPGTKLVVGGMHATTFTQRIISDPAVDFVIRGSGDIAFIQLLKSLEGGVAVDTIPGVVTGPGNLESFATPIDDLDAVPPYPYDLIDLEYLILHETSSTIYEHRIRTGLIMMSRGCPFQCSYCSSNKVFGRKVRFKSLPVVQKEIQDLIDKYKIEQLCIMDDLFGMDKQYFFDFFEMVEKNNFKVKLVIASGLSLIIFDEQMIDVLIKHGLVAAHFPLESGSQYVQKKVIKKNIDLTKARRLINYAKEKGLFVTINIVIGNPGETVELMQETIEFVQTLPLDWITFLIAYPYPRTGMTDTLLERGEITEDKLIEIWESSSQGFKERPFDTREISGKELSQLVYDYNIELNFFNNYNFRTHNYSNMLLKINKVIDRFPFHVVALGCRAKCYHHLGEAGKASDDVKTIDSLIQTNSESLRMYERYKVKLEEMIAFARSG